MQEMTGIGERFFGKYKLHLLIVIFHKDKFAKVKITAVIVKQNLFETEICTINLYQLNKV